MEGRNKSFIIRELVQNAWDESGVTRCDVTLEPIKGNRKARLVVEDDAPEGFYDLRHAYTLYAHTRKRSSPGKRGRFNIGEKQVLALCHSAKITTTKGTVEFLANGKRKHAKACCDSGSVFEAVLPMAKAEIEDCARAVRTFIPPEGVRTTFNGEEIRRREPLATVEATLTTELEDSEGRYRPSSRKTNILVYEPLPGEKAMIYEMGLPVIETGDRWHYDIQQRIPLTSDRDHVRSAFLQDVRAEVANAMASRITEEDASAEWIRDASADDRIKPETVDAIATLRWGEKRTVAFPGDSDGRDKAIAAGYHLVAPTEMSADEWAQMRKAGCVPAVSALFPQPKVPEQIIPKRQWTKAQKRAATLSRRIAELTLGISIRVQMIRSPGASTVADYSKEKKLLRFNAARLGRGWFNSPPEKIVQLIIHELGHEFGNHISEAYYEGLSRIGAKLALYDPQDLLDGLEAE